MATWKKVVVESTAGNIAQKAATSGTADNITSQGALAVLGSVAAGQIDNNAVTTTKLNDLAVTTGKLAAGAVTTNKIANDVVTEDKLADTLLAEIDANTAKVTNATHTGEVTGSGSLTIANNIVDEANLKVSNAPSDGYFLSAQSSNTGGLTWAAVSADNDDVNNANLLTKLAALESASGSSNETITIGTDTGDTISFTGSVNVANSITADKTIRVDGVSGVSSGNATVRLQGNAQQSWEMVSSGGGDALSFSDAGTNSTSWLTLSHYNGTSGYNSNIGAPILKLNVTSGTQSEVVFDCNDLDNSDTCYHFKNGNVKIYGSLEVAGSTTTINTETIKLADNIIELNSNASGSPSQDSGLTVNRGSSTNMSVFWDESKQTWGVGSNESSNLFTNVADLVTLKSQTYSSTATLANGWGAIGSFQLDGTDLYIRTA